MDTPDVPAAEATAPARKLSASTASQASRLFILPAIIVGACAFCLLVAGGLYALLQENQDPSKYIEQVVAGAGNRRWQAAYELSRVIAANDGKVDDATASMLIDVFNRSVQDDPLVRRYLTLALGRLHRPESARALRAALVDQDTETRIYALWGLGSHGDKASAPAVAAALGDRDSGVRKMAAYALGFLRDPGTSPALRQALQDRTADVRWNAAVALARIGDASGADVLLQMIDRTYLEGLCDENGDRVMDGERVREAMMTGVRGLVMIREPRAKPRFQTLSESEPDLRVRDAAIKGLEEIRDGAQPAPASPAAPAPLAAPAAPPLPEAPTAPQAPAAEGT